MLSDLQKEELYRTYYSKVFGYLRSRLNDTPTAEDLASDVFAKVYEKLDTFDEVRIALHVDLYNNPQYRDRLFPHAANVFRNSRSACG